MTRKKSTGCVLSSDTLPHFKITAFVPPDCITSSGTLLKSVRTVAGPLTGIFLSLASNRIERTAVSPVREIFSTEQRFRNESASSSLTASIGKEPSPKEPAAYVCSEGNDRCSVSPCKPSCVLSA